MLSKLESNRINARKSTGPRTQQGKQASSQNARTHGLTSKRLIIPPAMAPEFLCLQDALTSQLQPHGHLEHEVFSRLLAAAWTLRRVDAAEAALFDGRHDPLQDPEKAAQLDRLQRYRVSHERSLFRAINELRTLQTTRAHVLAEPALDQIPISPLIRIRPKRAHPPRTPDDAARALARFFPRSYPHPSISPTSLNGTHI